MNATASKIELGREVQYSAGYGSTGGRGVIVAIHGAVNHEPRQAHGGFVNLIYDTDCTVDVALHDGRMLKGIRQCSIDSIGIGIQLLDNVADAETVEAAKAKAAQYIIDLRDQRIKARAAFEAAEAARKIKQAPIFYYNGIRDKAGAKLQPCSYSNNDGMLTYPENTITIYARNYDGYSALVNDCFAVNNDTDLQTDYFAHDRIRVIPTHPLYPQVRDAMEKSATHFAERLAARAAKHVGQQQVAA